MIDMGLNETVQGVYINMKDHKREEVQDMDLWDTASIRGEEDEEEPTRKNEKEHPERQEKYKTMTPPGVSPSPHLRYCKCESLELT